MLWMHRWPVFLMFCNLKRDLNSNFYYSRLTSDSKNAIRITPFVAPVVVPTVKPAGTPQPNPKEPVDDFKVFSSFGPQIDSFNNPYSVDSKSLKIYVDNCKMVERVGFFDGNPNPNEQLLDINKVDRELELMLKVETQDVEMNDDVYIENLLNLNKYLIEQLSLGVKNPEFVKLLEQNLVLLMEHSRGLYSKDQIRDLYSKVPVYDSIYHGTL